MRQFARRQGWAPTIAEAAKEIVERLIEESRDRELTEDELEALAMDDIMNGPMLD